MKSSGLLYRDLQLTVTLRTHMGRGGWPKQSPSQRLDNGSGTSEHARVLKARQGTTFVSKGILPGQLSTPAAPRPPSPYVLGAEPTALPQA